METVTSDNAGYHTSGIVRSNGSSVYSSDSGLTSVSYISSGCNSENGIIPTKKQTTVRTCSINKNENIKVLSDNESALHSSLLCQRLSCISEESICPLLDNEEKHFDPHSDTASKKFLESLPSIGKGTFVTIISPTNGVILYITDSLTDVLGFPKVLLIGRSFIDLVHPKDKVGFASFITKDTVTPIADSSCLLNNASASFYCHLKRFIGTDGPHEDIDNVMYYSSCELKIYLKDTPGDKNDSLKVQKPGGSIFLVILTQLVTSAYKVPNELMQPAVKFSLRHSPLASITYADNDVIPYLGYLPQDLKDKSIFEFYHPEDMTILKELYRNVVKDLRSPIKSLPIRFLCQNGDYVVVTAECSVFINPWSQKIEFVIVQYSILNGPNNIDVATPVQRQHTQPTQPSNAAIVTESDAIQEQIIAILSKEYESSLGISTHTSEKSNLSSTNYKQLNYNETLQRFFESKPKLLSDDTSESIKDDNGITRCGISTLNNRVSEGNELASNDVIANDKFINHTTDVSNYNAASDDTAVATDSGCCHLTEAVLCKHNEYMKKEMAQKHREQKSPMKTAKNIAVENSAQNQENKSAKVDECSRGIKRCASNFTVNQCKLNKYHEPHTNIAANSNDANVPIMTSSIIDSDTVSIQMPLSSSTASPTYDAVTNMSSYSAITKAICKYYGVGNDGSQSISEPVPLSCGPDFTEIPIDGGSNLDIKSQNGKKDDSESSERLPIASVEVRNTSSSSKARRFSADSDRNTDFSSSDAVLNSNECSLSGSDLCCDSSFGTSWGNCTDSSDKINPPEYNYQEPPWQRDVVMTPYLVYQYQLEERKLNDVLRNDLQNLCQLRQPTVVIHQLNQLFSEMQMDGVPCDLTFEEGLTSSSSDEDEPSIRRINKKEKKYNKLAFLFEENAPLPPPCPLPSFPSTD